MWTSKNSRHCHYVTSRAQPFPRNEKEDGTLELYYFSAYCLPKILLLQLVGYRVIQRQCSGVDGYRSQAVYFSGGDPAEAF